MADERLTYRKKKKKNVLKVFIKELFHKYLSREIFILGNENEFKCEK